MRKKNELRNNKETEQVFIDDYFDGTGDEDKKGYNGSSQEPPARREPGKDRI